MKSRIFAATALATAIAAGVAAGYEVAVVKATGSSFLVRLGRPAASGFDGVLEDFARLGAYESIAADCSGMAQASHTLNLEVQTIQDLEQRSSVDAGVLSLAEATVMARAANASGAVAANHGHLGSVDVRLDAAGWDGAAATKMPDILKAVDQDQCRCVTLGGVK